MVCNGYTPEQVAKLYMDPAVVNTTNTSNEQQKRKSAAKERFPDIGRI